MGNFKGIKFSWALIPTPFLITSDIVIIPVFGILLLSYKYFVASMPDISARFVELVLALLRSIPGLL